MSNLGKWLILVGGVFVAVGVVLKFGLKIPFLGRLPGDIHIKNEGVEFYLPLATSLLLSVVLSAVLWIVSFVQKKSE